MKNKELLTLIENKIEIQAKKCRKLEDQVEALDNKEYEEKQPKLDELANKIDDEDEKETKLSKASKTWHNISAIFLAIALISPSLLGLSLWLLIIPVVSFLFGASAAVISVIKDKKALECRKNMENLREVRDALGDKKSEELYKLECKLNKAYGLLNALRKEKSVLIDVERLIKEKANINKKYSKNNKTNEEELTK